MGYAYSMQNYARTNVRINPVDLPERGSARIRPDHRVIVIFRVGVFVGLLGMLASACWLTAATLQNAAYVRMVGQVELLFMFAASVLFYRENPVGWK